MSGWKEIVPGIYTWAKFSEEKQMNFNGHAVVLEGSGTPACVLIDPPAPDETSRNAIRKLGAVRAILLTNKDHRRDAAALRTELPAPVWGPRPDASLFDIPLDRTFDCGDLMFDRLKVIGLDHLKSPGESALYDSKTKSMFIGDAVIGKVPGKLNLLPPEKIPDPVKARESLRPLLEFDFAHLLIGDGTSILNRGKEALAEFLK